MVDQSLVLELPRLLGMRQEAPDLGAGGGSEPASHGIGYPVGVLHRRGLVGWQRRRWGGCQREVSGVGPGGIADFEQLRETPLRQRVLRQAAVCPYDEARKTIAWNCLTQQPRPAVVKRRKPP